MLGDFGVCVEEVVFQLCFGLFWSLSDVLQDKNGDEDEEEEKEE